jgi:hypothetical protein
MTERSIVDTVHNHVTFDLDSIEYAFENFNVDCAYSARGGVYISLSADIFPPHWHEERRIPESDIDAHMNYALTEKYLFPCSSNFITRPEPFTRYFNIHPHRLVEGDGSFGNAVVWEERIGKILCNACARWYDLDNKVGFQNIAQLRGLEEHLQEKLSTSWVRNMVWVYYYGGDLL